MARATAGLGVTEPVAAELYKSADLRSGQSFHVSHRDTEKAPGMFATLIVTLPSLHAGGELVLRQRAARCGWMCAARILRKRPQPSMPIASRGVARDLGLSDGVGLQPASPGARPLASGAEL